MHGNLKSIVPIMRPGEFVESELVGTGIVVAPSVVLTCQHVVERGRSLDPGVDPRSHDRLFVGQAGSRPSRVETSGQHDLALLFFTELPDTKPVRLFRSRGLKGFKLSTVGFKADTGGVRAHESNEMTVSNDEISERRLQASQIKGGVDAFSGAPVFAEPGGELVGMLTDGGARAAASWMVAVDPISRFLAEYDVIVEIGELVKCAERADPKSGSTISIGGKVVGSRITVESAGGSAVINAAKSVEGSDLRAVSKSGRKH